MEVTPQSDIKAAVNDRVTAEAVRIARMAISAGIPKDQIAVQARTVAAMLNKHFYEDKGTTPMMVAGELCNFRAPWTKFGGLVLVDGGDVRRRSVACYAAAFQVLLAHPTDAASSRILAASRLIAKLNTFRDDRFALAEDLEVAPCLCVLDLDHDMTSMVRNDGRLMFETVFAGRARRGLPTIVSVSRGIEQGSDWAAFGRTFSDQVEAIRERYPDDAVGGIATWIRIGGVS